MRGSNRQGKSDVMTTDVGCHLHPSCLSCPEVPPLSMCVFDFPGYEKGWRQYKQIKHLLLIEKLSIEEIAKKMKLKKSIVQDILDRVDSMVLI